MLFLGAPVPVEFVEEPSSVEYQRGVSMRSNARAQTHCHHPSQRPPDMVYMKPLESYATKPLISCASKPLISYTRQEDKQEALLSPSRTGARSPMSNHRSTRRQATMPPSPLPTLPLDKWGCSDDRRPHTPVLFKKRTAAQQLTPCSGNRSASVFAPREQADQHVVHPMFTNRGGYDYGKNEKKLGIGYGAHEKPAYKQDELKKADMLQSPAAGVKARLNVRSSTITMTHFSPRRF